MIRWFKRLTCKHEWEYISSNTLIACFGCNKCGSTQEMANMVAKRWKFERKHKGETFK